MIRFFLIFLLVTATTARAEGPSGKEIITRMIDRIRGHANIAEYEMRIHTPHWERTLAIKVWDHRQEKKLFIRILAPAKERGTGFLRVGYNLWMYLPKVEKITKIPPSLMFQPWMGSDFTNDDLVKESSYIEDYNHTVEGTEDRNGEAVWRIRLEPKPHAPVVWGKTLFWVLKKEPIPVEQSFFDEKGNLMKDLRFTEVKKVDGLLFPTVWTMRSTGKRGSGEHWTLLTLKQIDFDPSPPIPAATFSQENLQRNFNDVAR